jgi:DNA processing protein
LAGGTIAVLAGGLDRPYPPQNLALHAEIVERGLVVSEMPLGFQARAQDFPRRNFIVSGLSLGIVVIEAAVRSGSLITARAGAEQGRDVMAVPGSPLDPRGKGSNALIKQGATLVEDAEDVLAVIGATPQRASRRPSAPLLEPVEDRPGLAGEVLALLSPAATPIDEIARRAGAPIAAVAAAITELELDGRAATLAGGLVERR